MSLFCTYAVCYHMFLQVSRWGGCITTHATMVSLFSSVPFHMFLKSIWIWGWKVTMVAFVPLLCSMRFHMSFQITSMVTRTFGVTRKSTVHAGVKSWAVQLSLFSAIIKSVIIILSLNLKYDESKSEISENKEMRQKKNKTMRQNKKWDKYKKWDKQKQTIMTFLAFPQISC